MKSETGTEKIKANQIRQYKRWEGKAFKTPQTDTELIIQPKNKGKATMVIDKLEYSEKLMKMDLTLKSQRMVLQTL